MLPRLLRSNSLPMKRTVLKGTVLFYINTEIVLNESTARVQILDTADGGNVFQNNTVQYSDGSTEKLVALGEYNRIGVGKNYAVFSVEITEENIDNIDDYQIIDNSDYIQIIGIKGSDSRKFSCTTRYKVINKVLYIQIHTCSAVLKAGENSDDFKEGYELVITIGKELLKDKAGNPMESDYIIIGKSGSDINRLFVDNSVDNATVSKLPNTQMLYSKLNGDETVSFLMNFDNGEERNGSGTVIMG